MNGFNTEQFLANLRKAKTAYCEAHGLPVPDFTEEDHYMLPHDYYEWRDGIPRVPDGSNRLTWRSKAGNVVAVSRNGYAYDDYTAAHDRIQEILERLAMYEDTAI